VIVANRKHVVVATLVRVAMAVKPEIAPAKIASVAAVARNRI